MHAILRATAIMATTPKAKVKLPAELSDVASIHAVNLLEEKLARCYSADKYQDFQGAVETIIERYLETDTAHNKLKTKINRQIKDYLEEKGFKNKMFWVPTVISIVSAIVAVVAVVYK